MALHLPAAALAYLDLHRFALAIGHVNVDLGTGDGAFALRLARQRPGTTVIALDTNLDRQRGSRRRHPENVRFVVADAIDWPLGMLPAAETVTINFPYRSLLRALVDENENLVPWLDALLHRAGGARLAARVNRTAFLATGLDPERGPEAIAATLRPIGGARVAMRGMAREELRLYPSTWAKPLGYGRETDAVLLQAVRATSTVADPVVKRQDSGLPH